MFTSLNLARFGTLLGAVLSALVIFQSAASQGGKYTAGGVFAGLLAVWLHEEHATERNATSAAASITPPPAPAAVMPTAADMQGILAGMGLVPGGALPTAPAGPAAPAAAPSAPSAPGPQGP